MSLKIVCRYFMLFCAFAAFLSAQQPVVPVTPQTPQSAPAVPEASGESPELWFVELSSPPAAEGTPLQTLQGEKAAFRAAARSAGVTLVERYAFDQLWNGLSIRIRSSQVARLSNVAGVKNIYPVLSIPLPPIMPGGDPELATALAMTGADVARSELGYTGAGVRVAVMDTGIDYHHRDLGGCFGPGCRVEKGWDFVGDSFPTTPPAPDADPDDCNGHGTHVAGIIGADGGVTGVAPGVKFYAYRVFGCTGGTYSDIMIAAMERALADGAQILNMSIGSARQWPQYPTAQAADRLVNKGVVVVAAAGNDGTQGLYASSAPAVGKKTISVASYDNTHSNSLAFKISPDNRLIPYNQASNAALAPISGSGPMARTGTPGSTADACTPLPAGSLTDKIALIRRGTCLFRLKAENAMAAGAVAVVIYNNVSGSFIPAIGIPALPIPVVATTQADGVLINDRIAAGGVTLTWTTDKVSTPISTGGLIASSSSYGVAPDLTLKPDLGAPGGNIRSTYPLELGGYAILGGTSMASPHVAGAAALLLEARPHTPSQAVNSILQNNAEPKNWWGNPGLGYLDQVHRQGAGMMQIDDAILARTRIEPGNIELGESEGGPVTVLLTLRNESASPVQYALAHAPALSTGPDTFSPTAMTGFATVSFSAPTVSLAPGGSAVVYATITAHPGLPDRSLYGGYIVFLPVNPSGETHRVPYSGFKGDYQSIPVLVPTSQGYPWLQKAGAKVTSPDGATYTMLGDDLPAFRIHLDHPVRLLRMEVFDAVTGRAWHRATQIEYMPRNSARMSYFGFVWDGVTVNGNKQTTAPNGKYVMKLSVLKALGESGNPAHWETWTSPPITINRP